MPLRVQKQVLYWGGAFLVLLITLWLLGNAIMPFILGAAVAYLFDPLADRLERLGLSRTTAVVLLTLCGLILDVALFLLLMPVLVRQTTALIETAPEMFQRLQLFLMTRFPEIFTERSE